LCDTTTIPSNSDTLFWDYNGDCFHSFSSTSAAEYYKNLKSSQQEKIFDEYLRLLYVAMTRAEDHLIICGIQGENDLSENCWYQIINNTMYKMCTSTQNGILIYGKQEEPLITNNKQSFTNQDLFEEEFIPQCHAPIHAKNTKIINSSEDYIDHPLNPSQEYGIIFHKILEDTIASGNVNIMAQHPLITNVGKIYKDKILQNISKILSNRNFTDLLSANILLTEVSIGSLIKSKTALGRIDLLIEVRHKPEVIIIDYKSDIKPPILPQDIPISYKHQLALYKQILSNIYQDKTITTQILWLENANLMTIV
jgi:ATP-dependent helicase/nuclease subunit A